MIQRFAEFSSTWPRAASNSLVPALIAAGFVVWCVCGTVTAQSILPNGSFEGGKDAPAGWRALAGGTTGNEQVHHGQRSLHGKSRTGAPVWTSDTIELRPRRDYRIEGWVRCSSGEAWLSVELMDQSGRAVGSSETPHAGRSGWRYIAAEWNAAGAASVRVSFRVKGEADLDDVNLALVENSYMGNKGVESDERGRIPFWGEEKTDSLVPGRRAGTLKSDPEIKREGKSGVQLTSTGDWFAVASVNYPVAAWTDRLELSGWARCGPLASAQILACWTDDAQNVLRVDSSTRVVGPDWQRIVLVTVNPPAQAANVRLVAASHGGAVWFDDFELMRLRPQEPRAQVFVNQVGYESSGPKSVVIASNFFPHDTDTINFELVPENSAGHAVLHRTVTCAGRVHSGEPDDWGWYCWRVEFSQFQKAGLYRAVARLGNVRAESAPFQIGRGLLLGETARNAVDFFHVQRCGGDVPGWHKACHLDDAKLPDGTRIDAIGGWHSAGDYNKLMYEHGDGGVVFALLTAYDFAPERFQRFDRDGDGLADALEEANWGAAFVAKMQIPETGGLRNHLNQGPGRNWTKWSAPEVHTDNTPGTDDDPVIQPGEGNSPLVIAAWARLSGQRTDRSRSPRPESPSSSLTNDYLSRAVRLWSHATKGGTEAGSPYLLISTLELHRATGDPAYFDFARRSVDKLLLSRQTTNGPLQGAFGNYGDTTAAALAQFALDYPKDERVKPIKRALDDFITFCARTADNPFGISPQTVGGTNTFFPADLGANFQVLSRAWAAALVYRVTHNAVMHRCAQDHVDWVLGKNPLNLCMFEGKGAVNPPRYHHRYNAIPEHERGAVPGAIPNGFVRDMGLADRPGFDLSRAGGRAPSFRTSEPWLVHNLFYLLAAGALERAVRE
jgi:hypothetical protein